MRLPLRHPRHLRDGEVRYIEGNPEHPLNKGVICAKGASGIMKQYSPARLTQPLRRKPGAERGAGEFEAISWDEAFDILAERLAKIRATDPKKFALFTGRDQMQALTGLFARQFGTPNYAAHGGFCSVNMAAGMIYTIGGSFWEFGGPDLDRAKLFVMIGTAEDHHSNPLKIALSKFKRDGGRFISINPVRTGYSAIADEWVPIKPGTDGALLLALIHEIIKQGLYDRDFLVRYTNAGQLVNLDEASDRVRHVRAHRGAAGGRLLRSAEQAVVGPRHQTSRCRRTPRAPTRTCSASFTLRRRHAGQAGVPAAGGARRGLHARNGPRASPAFRPRPSAAWRTRWASPRATRRSSCRSPGPTAGARSTRPSPATRWPSTPCAAWRRTPTAFRPFARWRS